MLLQVQGQIQSYASYIVPIILFVATQFVMFVTYAVTVHIRTNSRIKALEIKVEMMDRNAANTEDKLDEILACVHKLEVRMEGKQNRS